MDSSGLQRAEGEGVGLHRDRAARLRDLAGRAGPGLGPRQPREALLEDPDRARGDRQAGLVGEDRERAPPPRSAPARPVSTAVSVLGPRSPRLPRPRPPPGAPPAAAARPPRPGPPRRPRRSRPRWRRLVASTSGIVALATVKIVIARLGTVSSPVFWTREQQVPGLGQALLGRELGGGDLDRELALGLVLVLALAAAAGRQARGAESECQTTPRRSRIRRREGCRAALLQSARNIPQPYSAPCRSPTAHGCGWRTAGRSHNLCPRREVGQIRSRQSVPACEVPVRAGRGHDDPDREDASSPRFALRTPTAASSSASSCSPCSSAGSR